MQEKKVIAGTTAESGKLPVHQHIVKQGYVPVNRSISILTYSVQILTGISVTTLSLLGFIKPLWLAAVMNFAGCASSMLGAWLLYDTISRRSETNNLVRDAIRRVIEFRN